ncbi:MAG: hypothetical protein WAK03_05605 [Methylocystis sp.]
MLRYFVVRGVLAMRVDASPVKELARVLIKHGVRREFRHQHGQALIVAIAVIKQKCRGFFRSLRDQLAAHHAIFLVKQFGLQHSNSTPVSGR